MADQEVVDEKSAEQKPQQDELKNLKAEFSRKQENVVSELAQIKQMLAQQAQVQQRHQKVEPDEIPDPILDPKAYKDYIKREVLQETTNVMQNNNTRNAQLSALVTQYPELHDGNSELTKRAVEMYNGLSDYEKQSPNAYKFAVQDAASDLGVLAMNKRPKQNNNQNEDDESFTTNSGSYGSNRPSKQKKQDDKIDDATLAFAQAIGKDIKDPKYLESLKKHTSRKSWNKGQ